MKNIEKFVHEWIDAWNSRDLEKILSHYSDDIEITTPMISITTGNEESTLKGKKAIAAYWAKALEKLPDLHFVLLDWTEGVNCVSIYYESVMNLVAIETMWLNDCGKVYRMNACYRKKKHN
ncbi:nuclear transport factor 2 family protein [Hydrogenimonas sp.]